MIGTDTFSKRDEEVYTVLNPEIAQTMTVCELASALEEQMREFGYAESSLITYRGICAKIVHYFEERDVERFNIDLGQKFIVEYGGDRYGTNGALKNHCRAVRMLSDLQQYGMIFKGERYGPFRLQGLFQRFFKII